MDPKTIALLMLMLISGAECSMLFFIAGFFRGKTAAGSVLSSLFRGSGTTLHVRGVFSLMTQGIVSPWFSIVFANSAIMLG